MADHAAVEAEVYRLIMFINKADPAAPPDQRRFPFHHNELGTISKAEARAWSQHPQASALTVGWGVISA
jgi:hypothetical protein